MTNNTPSRTAVVGLAAVAFLPLAAPEPPQETGSLARFANGEVADADDVNANFDFLNGLVAERTAAAAALTERVAALETENAALRTALDALTDRVTDLEATSLSSANVAKLEQVLPLMSLVQTSDGFGGTNPTLLLRGVNLQIVNRLTGDDEATNVPDGTGNLILGFNEQNELTPVKRTGSHNLVLGKENAYQSTGGIVAGLRNLISGPGGSVLGGEQNRAAGPLSVVGGGFGRSADDAHDFAAGSILEDN